MASHDIWTVEYKAEPYHTNPEGWGCFEATHKGVNEVGLVTGYRLGSIDVLRTIETPDYPCGRPEGLDHTGCASIIAILVVCAVFAVICAPWWMF